MNENSKLKFEILIDEMFINTNNKKLLSLINDFEDGEWRYDKFRNFVWNNIGETALSAIERESLIDEGYTVLVEAAKNLRLTEKKGDIGKGSEIAEIVLYGIMKHHYNALAVVPKIFYKQNNQDNAKGADSVHIVIENDNDFSIWLGEAKFYKSIENKRLVSIIESVKNSMDTNKLKKENSIITNLSDLDSLVKDEKLKKSIKNTLSQESSIDIIKPKLNIPILLLHECDITKKATVLTDEYKNQIREFHKDRADAYFKKQISKLSGVIHMYKEIKFHLGSVDILLIRR